MIPVTFRCWGTYASLKAGNAQRASPHFQKDKQGTLRMAKDL